MNPISFRSTYVVTNKNPIEKFLEFLKLAQEEESSHGAKHFHAAKCIDPNESLFSAKLTLVAPDSRDNKIEDYCARRGISYSKHKTEDLMQPEAIRQRIAPAEEGYQKVEINVDELEKLLQKFDFNFEHCESEYNKYYKNDTEMMLRKASDVPASTLWIIPMHSDIEGLIKYIESYGAENLNDGQINIQLSKKTDDPDHCMYFAMKKLGMKKIPVYVNQESLALCEKLGLLE
ncbi:MAG: hypothetical protein IKU37_09845 [Candidatus Gastranaerophilales bacterium]|nr:hypothetical protein [Candidatus Gastranaerophilales bacterium]